MTWTVRTTQLPAVAIGRESFSSEDSAWLGYFLAVHAAEQSVADAEDDLVVGVDLRRGEQVLEQHAITRSRGVITTGRLTP